jgi:HEAT repeat protein
MPQDPSSEVPQEGDELWFGLVGPIRVSDEVTPERAAWSAARKVAQAAHSLTDLAQLVTSHPDPRVRCEAIPRLRARFPDEQLTLEVLIAAADDSEPMVRDGAVDELGWISGSEAADAIARHLEDEDFDVRMSAAQGLAFIGDGRAPLDPEAWALEGMVNPPDRE